MPIAQQLSPEHWSVQAGNAATARLDIPADIRRERRFEIAVSMSVSAFANAASPWHELRVHADGQLQWQRRIPTQHPAPFDGLDYRFQCSVAVGRTLRLLAFSECGEAQRLQLRIDADET
jgi:hypothetical protein